jgi:phospholipid transport system substrate-binding protein
MKIDHGWAFIWRQILVILASLLISVAMATSVSAETPTEVVQSTVDSVLNILNDASVDNDTKRRLVKAAVSQRFDFTAMSSRVLATNWKTTTPAQQKRFTGLFKELLTNTYWRRMSGYEHESVEFLDEKLRGETLATVNTLIRTATVDIPVDYMLYRGEDGTWYAYDVVIEQVSLVRNYRGGFQTIVHDVGIEGLLVQLETKVAKASLQEP